MKRLKKCGNKDIFHSVQSILILKRIFWQNSYNDIFLEWGFAKSQIVLSDNFQKNWGSEISEVFFVS